MEHGPSGSHSHDRLKSRSKKKIKCYKYGEMGQVKKECLSNQKKKSKDPESSNAQACVANTLYDGDILYSEAIMVVEDKN